MDGEDIYGHRLSRLEEEVEDMKDSVSKIRESQITLGKDFQFLNEILQELKDEIRSLNKNISALKDKKGDDFDHYVKLIVGAILMAVVGYILRGWGL